MIKGLLIAFAAALPAFAALGGTEESVVADQVKFQAGRRVVPERGYSVHEISRDDGTLIREYVSPAGKVFGVSWKGPSLPDLSQLLGSNFAEFKNGLHPKPGRRRVAVVRNKSQEPRDAFAIDQLCLLACHCRYSLRLHIHV